MFNKKQLKVDLYEPSKIGHKTKIKGKIFSKNDFRLDGSFNGKLTCEKSIIIGKNGVFKGELNCKNLVINGYVEAQIIVSHKTSVNSTAEFKGNLLTDKLEVELGAILEGNFNTHTQNKISKSLIKIDLDNQLSISNQIENTELEIQSNKIISKKEDQLDTEVIAVKNDDLSKLNEN